MEMKTTTWRKKLPYVFLIIIGLSLFFVVLRTLGGETEKGIKVSNIRPIHYPKIFLFGDSLTQQGARENGFVALLTQSCERKCDVMNRGFGGYNTTSGKIILPRLINKDSDVDFATIFFGTNDASLYETNPSQHVPIKLYQENLIDMVVYLLDEVKLKEESVILLCPPPTIELRTERPKRNNIVTKEYARICEETATRMRVGSINFWELMSKEQGWESFLLEDGIHFSSLGNKFVFDKLQKALKISSLEQFLPSWLKITHENLL